MHFYAVALKFVQIMFEQHPFLRGMLIDKHQPLRIFKQQITSLKLPQIVIRPLVPRRFPLDGQYKGIVFPLHYFFFGGNSKRFGCIVHRFFRFP